MALVAANRANRNMIGIGGQPGCLDAIVARGTGGGTQKCGGVGNGGKGSQECTAGASSAATGRGGRVADYAIHAGHDMADRFHLRAAYPGQMA